MKIGMRIVKTAIAVFICLLIYVILDLFTLIDGVPNNFAITWYNPFFGGLATAYSLQSTRSKSISQAKTRCIASVIGGVVGILLIYFYELCGGVWPVLVEVQSEKFNYILPYLLTSLTVVVVIVLGNILRQPQAIFVSLLTFLSVTINPSQSVPNWEFQFGINRILSTVVGVLVALLVNFIHVPHKYKNKNMLFCFNIEGILKNNSADFEGFLSYKLNQFSEIGINYTFFTTRTPSTFMYLADNYNLKNPIICMSGAALYDPEKKTYLKTTPFDVSSSNEIRAFFNEEDVTPFINIISNDVHYIYQANINNDAELLYENLNKNASYVNYIKGEAPVDAEVLYFLLLEEEDKVNEIIEKLDSSDLKDKYVTEVYEFLGEHNLDKNLKYLKIYSADILKLDIISDYKKANDKYLVSFVNDLYAYPLTEVSDYVLTVDNADSKIINVSDEILKDDSFALVFKKMHKLYYKKI